MGLFSDLPEPKKKKGGLFAGISTPKPKGGLFSGIAAREQEEQEKRRGRTRALFKAKGMLKPVGAKAVLFSDLRGELLRWMAHFDVIVGCVAWVTHTDVIDAINGKKLAQVVIQKESWRHERHQHGRAYKEDSGLTHQFPEVAFLQKHEKVGRFRVFGEVEDKGLGAQGRSIMHHKFLVGCELPSGTLNIVPESVWMGSFNFTGASNYNRDSAVILGREEAVPFFWEWHKLLLLSEPFDTKHKHMQPQWNVTKKDFPYWDHI